MDTGFPAYPDASPAENTTTQSSPANQSDQGAVTETSSAPSLTELDKLEKFLFQGQEYTPKDLEQAMWRLKDYTQKTQSVAKERESLDSERKFYENLHYDLSYVRSNPTQAVIQDFINTYPQKFHAELKKVLGEVNSSNSQSSTPTQGQPQPDVELMSRIANLEKFYHEQEVQKNVSVINSKMEQFSKVYPDAIPELVLTRLNEAMGKLPKGSQVSDQLWEDTFKTVDHEEKERLKVKYGEYVKKQTEANAKARDVESGGGTPGRAPMKYKTIEDIGRFASKDLASRSRG